MDWINDNERPPLGRPLFLVRSRLVGEWMLGGSMKRSAGVTVIAVLQILGSTVSLLMGLAMFALMRLVPLGHMKPEQQATAPLLPIVGGVWAVMGAGFCAWGVATAVGLLKLKPWARISTLIYAGLLVAFTVLPALFIAVMPTPPESKMDAASFVIFKIVMALFYLAFSLIGVWWLIYFTRRGVKAQFYGSEPPPPSVRPVSISIIGWVMVIGAPFALLNAGFRFPMLIFGCLVAGWTAASLHLVFGAILFWTGRGLLKLRRVAWRVALGLLALIPLNNLFVWTHPDVIARLQAASTTMWHLPQQPRPFPFPAWLMIAFSLVFAAVPAFFLWKNRAAFSAVEMVAELPPMPDSPAGASE